MLFWKKKNHDTESTENGHPAEEVNEPANEEIKEPANDEIKETTNDEIKEMTNDEIKEMPNEIHEDIKTSEDISSIVETKESFVTPETEKKGFFRRLVSGLAKTRANIVSGIDSIFSGFTSIDDNFYEEIEETLIMGDLGVATTEKIIDELKLKVKELKIKEPLQCKELLINTIKEQMDLGENAYDYEKKKSIVFVIGVNGVGKTTSIGKLSSLLKKQGKKVILAAADTFRAAAIEQLTEWSNRSGVDIIAQQEGSDPGAVVYDAIQAAKARKADVLLCDTAGRLHNKKNLMDELKKIDRIIEKEYSDAYRENLIVLDATTGQNALVQAKEFMACTNITGVILTKMDGTAKGGIAVAIQAELGIPVKYIGVGEKIEDLQKFNANDFVDALFETRTE